MFLATANEMRTKVFELYRRIALTAREFPDKSIGRKLRYNAKELIRLYRHESDPKRIELHITQGYKALKIYDLLQQEPLLLQACVRKIK